MYLLPYVGKDKDIVKAMYRRKGWYASVEQEGKASKGDAIEELSSSWATITKMARARTAHSATYPSRSLPMGKR